MTAPSPEHKIAQALLDIQAVGCNPQNPVTFKSGIVSPVYIDNRILPFHPNAWQTVIHAMKETLEREKLAVDVIAGMETAGIPHSAALSFSTAIPSVFVRKTAKEHGKKRRVEGGDVSGKRVILVEDTVTTGGSSLQGVEALREEGASVTDVLSIITYDFTETRQAFENAGVRLHTLTSFPAILSLSTWSTEDQAIVSAWLQNPTQWQT